MKDCDMHSGAGDSVGGSSALVVGAVDACRVASHHFEDSEVDVLVKDLQEWKERMARTQIDMKEEQQKLQLKITSFERLLASLEQTAPSEDDGTSSLVNAELEAHRGDFVKVHQRLDSVIGRRGGE